MAPVTAIVVDTEPPGAGGLRHGAAPGPGHGGPLFQNRRPQGRSPDGHRAKDPPMTPSFNYPFVAIVGQERLKLALILNTINPGLSGGADPRRKGHGQIRPPCGPWPTSCRRYGSSQTTRSTSVRIMRPENTSAPWRPCGRPQAGEEPPAARTRRVRVVELPVGGHRRPGGGHTSIWNRPWSKVKNGSSRGLLAAAHRGILYVDEVNLLDDHVVDVLLDSAAMGTNTIEREGDLVLSHPARFTLVGTMNPEGRRTAAAAPRPLRALCPGRGRCAMRPAGWPSWSAGPPSKPIRRPSAPAGRPSRTPWPGVSSGPRSRYRRIVVARPMLFEIAEYCLAVGVDGHRGDIVMLKGRQDPGGLPRP